jgi:hypothetical protein
VLDLHTSKGVFFMSAQNNARSPEIIGLYLGTVTATQTHACAKFTRKFQINSVRLSNDALLAQHASNNVVVELKNGSNVVAKWSTVATTGDGPLPAADFVTMVLTESNSTLPADTSLVSVVTIGGSGALTRASMHLEGFYV